MINRAQPTPDCGNNMLMSFADGISLQPEISKSQQQQSSESCDSKGASIISVLC